MNVEIQLTDFQAHEKTLLKLREGLSCVVGPTNVGKSSIVRAVRWLLYDSLRGTRHIRKGKDTAAVTLKLDQLIVERVKGKQGNRYRLNDTWFDTIGVGAPPEISKALQITPVKIDKDNEVELSVSMQLNPPFLILETDSTRAKFLNVLTGGHVIDASVRETSRIVRSIEDNRKTLRPQLEEAQLQLKSYDGLELRERKVEAIKADVNVLQSKQDALDNLLIARKDLLLIRASKEITEKKINAIRIGDVAANLQKIDSLLRLQQLQHTILSIRDSKRQLDFSLGQLKDKINETKQKILQLPDFECETCGQLVTAEVRSKQLVLA